MSQVVLKKSNGIKCSLKGASTSTMEAMKAEFVNRLECAVEKLKDARKEIREAVLAALKMKEDGDDIADCVMAAMAALASEN